MSTEFSCRVSRVLDSFGYGAQQREFRRQAYKYCDQNIGNLTKDYGVDTVGSKGEGITNMYESDTDMLLIFKNIICIERNVPIPTIPDNTTVLACDTDMCYYGHTFLEVVQLGQDILTPCCSVRVGHRYYLSSTALSELSLLLNKKHDQNNPGHKSHGITGPAISCTINDTDYDFVQVIPCYFPSLLEAWANRPRYHSWPSPEVRREVVNLGAVVAPTASAISINKRLEWRICFNAGETRLVASLKDTHVKLYVLLKAVKKDVLRPENKEITSYLLKNVVFWLAEFNPEELFTEYTLVDWLRHALEFLKRAVKLGDLPYYMIPQRNLLVGKMLPHQRDTMLTRLDDALYNGADILLQCGRLGRALSIVNPERLEILGDKRNMLEKLFLIVGVRRVELQQSGRPIDTLARHDHIVLTCAEKCHDIVLPEWRLLLLFGVDTRSIFSERIKSLLV